MFSLAIAQVYLNQSLCCFFRLNSFNRTGQWAPKCFSFLLSRRAVNFVNLLHSLFHALCFGTRSCVFALRFFFRSMGKSCISLLKPCLVYILQLVGKKTLAT